MADKISDAFERKEALDPAGSFCVQAPAGSGKTELLMQRFLVLLSLAQRPEEILALTFTKKAAGEMQTRILNSLRKAREGYEPSRPHEALTIGLAKKAIERDSKMGWRLIENPSRLKVQTIDSFCASLARQMPLLSRIGSFPQVTEDAKPLYREAAERAISLVEEDGPEGEAVRAALSHLDNSVALLTKRLTSMLASRDQWTRHITRGEVDGGLRALLEGSLRNLIEKELTGLSEAFPKLREGELARAARFAATNVAADSPVKALSCLEKIPGPEAETSPLWRGLRELFLTSKGEWRKQVNISIGLPPRTEEKKIIEELIESYSGNDRLREALNRASLLPDPAYGEDEWAILESLMRLMPVAERKLAEVFGERGQIDFQAISMAALSALGTDEEPTDLMLALDLKIQHILVDEYQDTSRAQLRLIEALTRGWGEGDGRTLFVVGDPMQSIYLFREAEVGLFLKARKCGIGGMRLKPLTLRSNFRSSVDIVEWVNGCFGQAFPQNEDDFTGSVIFSSSAPARQDIPGCEPETVIFSGRSDEEEARRISSIIKSVPEDETIAVLCRSRTHLNSIVRELKAQSISFRAQQIDRLLERPAVMDLYSLLRALYHPFDRVAWLSVLRAPWCGLGLADIHRLVAGDRSSSVWELMNDATRVDSLVAEGRERLLKTRPKLAEALELRGRVAPRRLLEGLWVSLGGPACVDDEGMEDAEAFLSLVEEAGESGHIDVAALAGKMEGLYAEHGWAVNLELMTIHRAKGLEFDHVILPGLGKPPRSSEKRLLVWMERGADLILAPIEKRGSDKGSRIYEYLKDIDSQKEELEQIRLFYVAATRAKKRLYLFGHVKPAEDGEIKTEARSFLSKIEGSLRADMIIEAKAEEVEEKPECAQMLKRLPSGWVLPEPPLPLETSPQARSSSIIPGPEFYWATEAVKHLGTAVHKYLCRIAREGVERWEGRLNGERMRIKGMLKGMGLSDSEAAKRAAQAIEIIEKALSDRTGRWILSAKDESRVEMPVSAVIGGEITHAVIDRTFAADGERWVIDYKTSLHEGGSVDEFLESERQRYKSQLEKYEKILRASGEGRTIRKGLYYPALLRFVEV